jgi:hypothetical protein
MFLPIVHYYRFEQKHINTAGSYSFINKVKLSLQLALEAHKVLRRRGSHIFYIVRLQMAVKLLDLRLGRSLPLGIFLELISVRG